MTCIHSDAESKHIDHLITDLSLNYIEGGDMCK